MIPDCETNFLHLADCLPDKYPVFYNRFCKALTDNKVEFSLLPGTKDVWAVDYMPIQTGLNHFVQFVYNPSYLAEPKDQATISNVDLVCKTIGIKTIKSAIKLDGGNIVRHKNAAVMTDVIFSENPGYSTDQLIEELHDLLEIAHLYIIPKQPYDFTGHADGMVRFLDEKNLLINDYSGESAHFRRKFEKAIKDTGLGFEKIPYNPYGNKGIFKANGDYINYLEMQGTVFVPVFDMAEDDNVIKTFESLFNRSTIVPVNSNDIANEGGVLNCISWKVRR